MLKLQYLNTRHEGQILELTGSQPEVIGRQAPRLILKDPEASRRHAELRLEGLDWIIEDLQSKNGTRINGSRIHKPTALQNGDQIQIGQVLLAVILENRGKAAAPSPEDSGDLLDDLDLSHASADSDLDLDLDDSDLDLNLDASEASREADPARPDSEQPDKEELTEALALSEDLASALPGIGAQEDLDELGEMFAPDAVAEPEAAPAEVPAGPAGPQVRVSHLDDDLLDDLDDLNLDDLDEDLNLDDELEDEPSEKLSDRPAVPAADPRPAAKAASKPFDWQSFLLSEEVRKQQADTLEEEEAASSDDSVASAERAAAPSGAEDRPRPQPIPVEALPRSAAGADEPPGLAPVPAPAPRPTPQPIPLAPVQKAPPADNAGQPEAEAPATAEPSAITEPSADPDPAAASEPVSSAAAERAIESVKQPATDASADPAHERVEERDRDEVDLEEVNLGDLDQDLDQGLHLSDADLASLDFDGPDPEPKTAAAPSEQAETASEPLPPLTPETEPAEEVQEVTLTQAPLLRTEEEAAEAASPIDLQQEDSAGAEPAAEPTRPPSTAPGDDLSQDAKHDQDAKDARNAQDIEDDPIARLAALAEWDEEDSDGSLSDLLTGSSIIDTPAPFPASSVTEEEEKSREQEPPAQDQKMVRPTKDSGSSTRSASSDSAANSDNAASQEPS